MIKLLTPSPTTPTNTTPGWVDPQLHLRDRVHHQAFYKPEWDGGLARTISAVDIVNGFPGHELKYDRPQLVGTYLRVGLEAGGAWRTFKVRAGFRRGGQDPNRGRHHRLGRRARRTELGDISKPRATRTRSCEVHRRIASIASSSGPDDADPSRPGQADRSRSCPARQFHLQLRAAHAASRRDGARVVGVREVHPADAAAARGPPPNATQATSYPPTPRAWWTASPRRIPAICKSGPTWLIR